MKNAKIYKLKNFYLHIKVNSNMLVSSIHYSILKDEKKNVKAIRYYNGII